MPKNLIPNRFWIEAAERLAQAKCDYAALDGWKMVAGDDGGSDQDGDDKGTTPPIDGGDPDWDAGDDDDDNDPKRLKETLAKERRLRRQFEREARQNARALKALKDADPEEFRRLQEENSQAELQRQQLLKQLGDYKTRAQQEAARLQQEKQALQQELQNQRRTSYLRDAFFGAGGLPDKYGSQMLGLTPYQQFERAIVPLIQEDPETGEYFALSQDGKTLRLGESGKPMTARELIDQLRDDNLINGLFLAPERGGSGGTQPRLNGPRVPRDRSQMSKEEMWMSKYEKDTPRYR